MWKLSGAVVMGTLIARGIWPVDLSSPGSRTSVGRRNRRKGDIMLAYEDSRHDYFEPMEERKEWPDVPIITTSGLGCLANFWTYNGSGPESVNVPLAGPLSAAT